MSFTFQLSPFGRATCSTACSHPVAGSPSHRFKKQPEPSSFAAGR